MAAMSTLLQSAAGSQTEPGTTAQGEGQAKADDVVDAEFEEVDKK
jgi:molecular chaperone DnaK